MKQTNVILQKEELEPFEVLCYPINTRYCVTINDDFVSSSQFENLVSVLDSATEGDFIEMRMDTSGGALHSIIPLLAAMENTQAHIHVHAISDVASAGTMLMMKAHSCYINKYATLMFHAANYSYGGHSGNMDAHVKYFTPLLTKLVNEVYEHFLSPEEITRLLDGKEIYMTAEEFHNRWDVRNVLLTEDATVAEEAVKPVRKPRKKKEAIPIGAVLQ